MRDPAEFDAFYKDARDRLLAQTFCLTGNLDASRRAVRDAFVAAWHRWSKVSQLDDPEAHVRPHAWRLAQRRHTGRVWHRERDLDDDVRATLEALGKLSVNQRKALLLTHLAAVSMPEMAREIGIPLEEAERELQSGTAQLSLIREIPAPAISTVLDPVGAAGLARTTWPRANLVRRAGATRRRTHTVVGVAAVAAGVVASGSLVTDAAGVHPQLHHKAVSDAPSRSTPGPDPLTGPPAMPLTEDTMVSLADIKERLPGHRWRLKDTDTDPSDNVVELPCQLEPFADGKGTAGLVRHFVERSGAAPEKSGAQDSSAQKSDKKNAAKAPRARLIQVTEMSRRGAVAKRAFRTTAGWFAECAEPEVQLLSTQTPRDVGDDAVQIVLRTRADPTSTIVVDVARTGLFTTTTVMQLPGTSAPKATNTAGLLNAAVGGLCDLEEAGTCPRAAPGKTQVDPNDPLPTGKVPALLSVVDLPSVKGVTNPWVATNPKQPTATPSVTPCVPEDFTKAFAGTKFSRGASRSFLIPEAGLPKEFGLTETVAALPGDKAKRFLTEQRARLAACAEKQLGTDVRRLAVFDDGDVSMTAWRLEIRVTRNRDLVFYVAGLRHGTAVGQLELVPAGKSLADGAFVDLARRAAARLGELPGPKKRGR